MYYDASRGGLGATPYQEQPDGSGRPMIVFVGRNTLDFERFVDPP